MEIGFLILSHQNPGLLRRLVSRLNRSFGDPPIVCHHDSHQAPLDPRLFPANTRFVQEPIRTQWAHISVVNAWLLALRRLFEWKSPDWFVLLSGSDYPIKPGELIYSELLNSPYDGYLDYRPIEYSKLPKQSKDSGFDLGFRRPFFVRVAYDRYITRRIPYRCINRKGEWCTWHWHIRHPRLVKSNPFKNGFKCFAGDVWMTARARCAELLLSSDAQVRELLDFYGKCWGPDESFFHTVLCNAPNLNLHNGNRRYEDWTMGKASPKLLGIEDLDRLLASNDHFARKFSDHHDVRVLDELDRLT